MKEKLQRSNSNQKLDDAQQQTPTRLTQTGSLSKLQMPKFGQKAQSDASALKRPGTEALNRSLNTSQMNTSLAAKWKQMGAARQGATPAATEEQKPQTPAQGVSKPAQQVQQQAPAPSTQSQDLKAKMEAIKAKMRQTKKD